MRSNTQIQENWLTLLRCIRNLSSNLHRFIINDSITMYKPTSSVSCANKSVSQCPVLSSFHGVTVENLRSTNPRAIKLYRRANDGNTIEADIPQTGKKRSLYRWFRNKFWCIRPASSPDFESDYSIPQTSSEIHNGEHVHVNTEMSQLTTSVEETKTSTLNNQSITTFNDKEQPTTTQMVVEKLPSQIMTKTPAKERQVTFSDTVKTHIKRKYVTAAEMRQIRGMNTNDRKITYQFLRLKNDGLGLKKGILVDHTDTRR